jgi:hypothetical protein
MKWSAEITNDPTQDYRLYIELLESGEFRAKIFRKDGNLMLVVYGCEDIEIPLAWLKGLIERAEKDI